MIRLKDLYDLHIVNPYTTTCIYDDNNENESLWKGQFEDIPLALADRDIVEIDTDYGAEIVITVKEEK